MAPRKFLLREMFFGLLFALAQVGFTYAQTSTFTYQGRFTDGGTAANGVYDMQFKLFDSPTVGAGNQIGATITNGAVMVTSGVFTVQLDYGAAAFPGANRFVEIGVRSSGSGGAYTLLSPRQPLTSAPYAIRAASTTTADSATTAATATNATQLGGVAASQYVQTNDSRLSDSRSPSAGSSNYVQNTAAQQASSNFNISGNGTAGGTLSGGTVNANTQFNLNGSRVLHAPGTGNLFAGASAGAANATGQRNAFFGTLAGLANNSGNDNAFFGNGAGNLSNASDNSFFGSGAGSGNTTGSTNSFFGSSAGSANGTASGNSFFGYRAGKATTNSANSFFGTLAGTKNTTGSSNSFFGNSAGVANTNGTENSFFGQAAGSANIDGSFNSFFGTGAGLKNTSGNANAFFGENAGFSNLSGNSNTFIGTDSGDLWTTGSGNTIVGSSAGYSAFSGDNNTALGFLANVNNGVSNATAIGFRAYASHSNTIILGSINGVNSTVDTSVGIGTINPTFRFHVRAPGQDGIKIQHNGTGDFPQIRWTDASDATKALISVGPVGSEALRFYVNGADRMIVESTGTVIINTLGAAGSTQLCRNASNQISTCSSSLRYKTNVASFTAGLSILNRLRPITFDWKQGGMHDLGFGAEDIAAVEPLLVTHNANGEVEGVKYDRITTVLVNAVKEQQQQIKQQQQQIASLKQLVCRRHPRAAACK